MNDVLEQIQQSCGNLYQLCPPLDAAKYDSAGAMLPAELFEILKISNGVKEMMVLPTANNSEPFAVGFIIESFEGMCLESKIFSEIFGKEALVFATNGADGFFIMNPDGSVDLFESGDQDSSRYAENLCGYIRKWCAPMKKQGEAE